MKTHPPLSPPPAWKEMPLNGSGTLEQTVWKGDMSSRLLAQAHKTLLVVLQCYMCSANHSFEGLKELMNSHNTIVQHKCSETGYSLTKPALCMLVMS